MGDPYHRLGQTQTTNLEAVEDDSEDVVVNTVEIEGKQPEYPDEFWKTGLVFLFLLSGMVTTTIALIVTNEQVPETPSLPDRLLDQVTYWPAGVVVSETIMAISMLTAFAIVILHSHRSIILRRIFFIVGLMYYYRAITMSITILPKPDMYWECPKQNASLSLSDVWNKLTRVAGDGGISLGDKQQFCGDYIFSGHTMVLIIAYLIVKEYSPKSLALLHWFSFFLFLFGVSALLLGRGHYSIDVLLGYWVTSRTWAIYHALANRRELREEKNSELKMVWWWRLVSCLEDKVPAGSLPHSYSWPLPEFVKRQLSRWWDRLY